MSVIRQMMNPGSSQTWKRFLIVFVIAWAFLIYLFAIKLNNTSQQPSEQDNTIRRINQALLLLEESKQRNNELRQIIDSFLSDSIDKKSAQNLIDKLEYKSKHSAASLGGADFLMPLDNPNGFDGINSNGYVGVDNAQKDRLSSISSNGEPSLEYEDLRRRIRSNTHEMWNYFSSEFGKLGKSLISEKPELFEDIKNILELGVEYKRSILTDMDEMRKVDGYEKWRHNEANELSDLIQRRFNYLQNPKDCKNARKLVCKISKGCGYGCQIHHLVYCMIVAYSTERTMILKSKGWRYHRGGWDELFQPVSDTCTDFDPNHLKTWPGNSDTLVISLPIIDSLSPRPPYLPLAIPEDLSYRMKKLHGDPIVWWIGQFLKYLLRPQHSTQEMINKGLEKLGWKKPIVGIHVRRTDKIGTEANLHEIEEYMTYVEDYYRTLEINSNDTTKKIPRRVFLASDDSKVIEQARRKYTNYEILGDPEVAKMAGLSTRYSESSLNGIIFDIHALSLCDYLVCTFSSQVCRMAYEIMQTFYPDASTYFKSLDDIYYYGGQNAHNRKAVIFHNPRNHNELRVKPGDLIGIAGNHWDGWSKGKNTRTDQVGLFPLFKTIDVISTVELPTYPNVIV